MKIRLNTDNLITVVCLMGATLFLTRVDSTKLSNVVNIAMVCASYFCFWFWESNHPILEYRWGDE